MDPQLHEIVDIATVNTLVIVFAIATPVAGILWGFIEGRLQGAMGVALKRGLLTGLFGPVVLVMWKFYSYMVRYDPDTGYVGLHKMSVYMLNVLIFAVVGVVLGLLYAQVWGVRGRRPTQKDT